MVGNGIRIFGEKIEHWNTHTIDTSNKVNGKPIYYWKNINGGGIPTGAGQAIVVNCTEVIIKDLTISKCDFGIQLAYSSRINVKENLIEEFGLLGIEFRFSNNNTVISNTISGGWIGVYLTSSNWNSFSNNIISNEGECISLKDSNGNYIYDNILVGIRECIFIQSSTNTSIEDNSMNGGGINIVGPDYRHLLVSRHVK